MLCLDGVGDMSAVIGEVPGPRHEYQVGCFFTKVILELNFKSGP